MIDDLRTIEKKKLNLFLIGTVGVLAGVIFLTFGALDQKAYATDYELGESVCETTLGATWDDVSTCTITNPTAFIGSNDTLTIPSGVTLLVANTANQSLGVEIRGNVTNHGTLSVTSGDALGVDNFGTITNSESGTINVSNTVDFGILSRSSSVIDNYGTINVVNTGFLGIYSAGTFNNFESGTLSIENTDFSTGIDNEGILNNFGALTVANYGTPTSTLGIESFGEINNFASGSITVENSGHTGIYHLDSTFTNWGAITVANSGLYGIRESGTLVNDGTLVVENGAGSGYGIQLGDTLVNTESGTVTVANTNGRGVEIAPTFGNLTNFGTMTVANSNAGFGIWNERIISNLGTMTVSSSGSAAHGIFNNDGTISNSGTLNLENADVSIGIFNHGTIENSGSMNVNSNFTNGGIENDFGTITNTGTLTVSSIDSTGIRGGFFGTSIITNNGTLNVSNNGGTGIYTASLGAVTNSGNVVISNTAGQGITIGGGNLTNISTLTVANSDGVGLFFPSGFVYNAVLATINNNGKIQSGFPGFFSIMNNSGTINNNGIFNNTYTSVTNINDDGTFNHEATGIIAIGPDASINVFCGGTFNDNGGSVEGIITFEDCAAPVITILGANPAIVVLGLTYSDAGVTVTDDVDTSPTLTTVSTVNTTIAGTYTVTYTAEDEAGKSSTAIRTVKVVTKSQATQSLIDSINAQVTDKNVKSALLSTLKEIQKILNDNKPANDSSACIKLADFITHVDSKEASGKLSSSLAQAYRDLANQIMTSLGC